MKNLCEGVIKFQSEVYPRFRELFEDLAVAQQPSTLMITCADSRVVPNVITQSDPGELFICRNAGNMVPSYGEFYGGVSATVEYAVSVLEVPHIVVVGHSDCGAMKALLDPSKVEHLPAVKAWLSHGETARRTVLENYRDLPKEQTLRVLTEENVIAQLQNLRTHPSVASRAAGRKLSLHGWVYDIGSGSVSVYDERRRRFTSMDAREIPAA